MSACPVAVGETWRSMKSSTIGEVIETKQIEGDWCARLRMWDKRVRWVSCTDHGLFGYRPVKP